MSDPAWERIQKLFLAAVERDGGERLDWVRANAPDAEAAARVVSLLAADDRPNPFDAIVTQQDSYETRQDAVARGARFGPWEVTGRLGQGGMGVVVTVRRADGQYEQTGALKILSRAEHGPADEGRFVAERQILAGLRHPNIGQLIDGGTASDGRPYFVMEHVDGVPIDEYCDRLRLDTGGRLRLFLAVCAAVQYAHQNLVAHRDLKPSNILVTADGAPKLLDFGIAKLLMTDAEGGDAASTQTGGRLFTPEYASPEQLLGQRISTASDVYQLGILLFLLLTGRHPTRDGTDHPLAETLVESLPDLPSRSFLPGSEDLSERARARGSTPEQLRRRLSGDLDSIVLKALRPEPARRYSTAGSLGDDIERHLDRRPVLARPDTLLYRAGKFIRRHGVATVAAIGAVLSLLGFAVGQQRQARATAIERDRSEEVVRFLVDLLSNADPYQARGEDVTVREALDRGADRVRTDLVGQPLVQATLMHAMGNVYHSLGLRDPALELLEEALDLRSGMDQANEGDLLESLRRVALVRAEVGDFRATDTLLPMALAMLRAGAAETPEDLAVGLNDIGYTLQLTGELERAEPLLEESLRIREGIVTAKPSLAATLNNLGRIREARGDLDSAAVLLRRSAEIRRSLDAGDPRLGTSLVGLAGVLMRRGSLDEAEQTVVEALEIQRRMDPRHPSVAGPLYTLGMIKRRQGRLDDAEQFLREALAIRTAALGEDHYVVAYHRNGLALVLQELGRLDEAELLFRRSLEVYEASFGPDHLNPAAVEVNLARLLARRDSFEEVRDRLEHALPVIRISRPVDRSFADDLVTLGLAQCRTGSPARADSTLLEAINVLRPDPRTVAPDDYLRALNARGSCLSLSGRNDDAESVLRVSLEASGDRPDADPYRSFARELLESLLTEGR